MSGGHVLKFLMVVRSNYSSFYTANVTAVLWFVLEEDTLSARR